MQYGRPPPQLRRTSSCLVCFLCNLMGNLRGCTSTPSPFSPPSCMEGVGWEHGELAWSLHASYPCSIPHPTPLPPLRRRPLCVSVMLSPYFSTFFERRKKGRSHMKLSFMAILIHGECGEYRLAADEPLIEPGYLAALLGDGQETRAAIAAELG